LAQVKSPDCPTRRGGRDDCIKSRLRGKGESLFFRQTEKELRKKTPCKQTDRPENRTKGRMLDGRKLEHHDTGDSDRDQEMT